VNSAPVTIATPFVVAMGLAVQALVVAVSAHLRISAIHAIKGKVA
jgi:hypothetical protein